MRKPADKHVCEKCYCKFNSMVFTVRIVNGKFYCDKCEVAK